jgi:hypothetical protein
VKSPLWRLRRYLWLSYCANAARVSAFARGGFLQAGFDIVRAIGARLDPVGRGVLFAAAR